MERTHPQNAIGIASNLFLSGAAARVNKAKGLKGSIRSTPGTINEFIHAWGKQEGAYRQERARTRSLNP